VEEGSGSVISFELGNADAVNRNSTGTGTGTGTGPKHSEHDRLLHLERAAMQSILQSGAALPKHSQKEETGVREILDSDWTNVVGVTPYAICVDHSKGICVCIYIYIYMSYDVRV
jgi:hypothetical protein